jgi:hypothetical protein
MEAVRKQQWKNLAEALDNLLHDRVGLTEGCRRVVSIGHSLELDTPLFDPFRGYESESGAFPLGDVRQLWSAEGLQEMDRQREKTEAHYRDWILEAAKNLHRYAKEQCA